jgi:hypothetical protein
MEQNSFLCYIKIFFFIQKTSQDDDSRAKELHQKYIKQKKSEKAAKQAWDYPDLFVIQWTPLNGIADNGINRLMGSNLSHLSRSK